MEGIRRGDGDEPVEQRQPTEPVEDGDDLWWDDVLEADAEAAKEEPEVDWDALEVEPFEDLEPEPKDVPEKPYRGGTYRDLPIEPGRDRHHLIPAWNLERAGRDPATGLAIQMDRGDHMKTRSWGNTPRAAKYRADVARLMEAGDEAQALRLGAEDVEKIAPGKYTGALDEAQRHADQ